MVFAAFDIRLCSMGVTAGRPTKEVETFGVLSGLLRIDFAPETVGLVRILLRAGRLVVRFGITNPLAVLVTGAIGAWFNFLGMMNEDTRYPPFAANHF